MFQDTPCIESWPQSTDLYAATLTAFVQMINTSMVSADVSPAVARAATVAYETYAAYRWQSLELDATDEDTLRVVNVVMLYMHGELEEWQLKLLLDVDHDAQLATRMVPDLDLGDPLSEDDQDQRWSTEDDA